jgi:hypothetical protein
MAVLWFYGRGADISGPVSGPQLAALAGTGQILPTDTVWRDGTEIGVPAGQVRHLFPTAPPVPGEPLSVDTVEPTVPVTTRPDPVADAALTGTRVVATKRGRAVAGKGVVIVGQDGATVKFRMKCSTCGREDSSWKSIAIPHGTARTGFFCTKCRKRRDGEIHGYH